MSQHSTMAQRKATLDRWVNSDLSLRQFAESEDIPISTLHSWKNKYLNKRDFVSKNSNPEAWSAEEKFSVVLETSTLSEVELSAYCREKGLFPDQIQAWKDACIQGNAGTPQPLIICAQIRTLH